MLCKACKREIDDDSIFCKYCGEKQIRERRKKKTEIKVPAPKQLPSGTWFGRVTVEGQRVSISAPTEKEYYAKARAAKAGLIKIAPSKEKIILEEACREFVKTRSAVLSPSTLRSYNSYLRNRFQEYMGCDVSTIDYQKMINEEAQKDISAKTLKNAWGLVSSSIKKVGVPAPAVRLPQVVKKELPWIEPEQIHIFLKAIRGNRCEMAALFALQGLRRSELIAVTPKDIKNGMIEISGSAVFDKNNDLVFKETNKNESSHRKVKIRIPRLQELINESAVDEDQPFISVSPNVVYNEINAICESAGLPRIGVHGLRRSFASLAYSLGWSELQTMKEGGWSDRETMNKRYIKLAEADAAKQSDSMVEFFENLQSGNENGNEH